MSSGIGTEQVNVDANQKLQWKIQMLLHINSTLIKKAQDIRVSYNNRTSSALVSLSKEQVDIIVGQYTKRIHCNLHAISQMNQGHLDAKPAIMDCPTNPMQAANGVGQDGQQQPQDMLAKMYLLMNRMFQLW